ncbi:hypothetical protein [Mechercharimyces sp. CAU 1602]|uniref:hypothetical protein n=1 Tax=Mechercharimyces sp. CAU 1602 TaxID=2973933 RepID=UPI00216342AC|nr:hypothetical protein [Mechercharimyces sp. CAU 1602]MCS1350821.1 hypothetical protein [Mechercharimyces sp. CAU 1602]
MSSMSALDRTVRAALTGDYTTLQPVNEFYFLNERTPPCPANVVAQLPAGILAQRPLRVLAVNMDIDVIQEVRTGNKLYRFSPSCTRSVSTLFVRVVRSGVELARIRQFEVSNDDPDRFTLFVTGPTGRVRAFNINFNHNHNHGEGIWTYR